jgi:hypothetical protein
MPPKKKKQPTETEVDTLLLNLSAELDKHNASKLEDKLRYCRYGNYINHDKLFSGKIKDKPFNEPSESGVKYYANDSVEDGQFLTLLNNAEWGGGPTATLGSSQKW